MFIEFNIHKTISTLGCFPRAGFKKGTGGGINIYIFVWKSKMNIMQEEDARAHAHISLQVLLRLHFYVFGYMSFANTHRRHGGRIWKLFICGKMYNKCMWALVLHLCVCMFVCGGGVNVQHPLSFVFTFILYFLHIMHCLEKRICMLFSFV